MALERVGEIADHFHGDVVDEVVVVAIFWEVADGFKIHSDAEFVANRTHLGKFDSRERVGGHGKSGDAERRETLHIGIVQSHLAGFIGVFVVHVMNDVDGIDIKLGHIIHNLFIIGDDIGIV